MIANQQTRLINRQLSCHDGIRVDDRDWPPVLHLSLSSNRRSEYEKGTQWRENFLSALFDEFGTALFWKMDTVSGVKKRTSERIRCSPYGEASPDNFEVEQGEWLLVFPSDLQQQVDMGFAGFQQEELIHLASLTGAFVIVASFPDDIEWTVIVGNRAEL